MKKLIAMILILAMMLPMIPAASAAEAGMTRQEAEAAVEALNEKSDFYYELVDKYDESDIEYRSEVRWWMAEGYHTDETLEEEIQAIYDAGFRGLELCQLNEGSISAADYGYGSEQWNHDFHLVLNKCLDLGMTVGMTSGAHWGTANVPGLDPDSQAANQCVVQRSETVSAGQSRSGQLPTDGLRSKAAFLGAYAWPKSQDPIYSDTRYTMTEALNSQLTTFTIETDFIIDKQAGSFCFGATGSDSFLMWQINTVHEKGKTYCRPHMRLNGGWINVQNFDVSDAIGYAGSDLIGKTIHMKIEVLNGTTINTYFNNSETAAFTYTVPGQWNNGVMTLNNLMFRMNTDYDYDSEEIARFDNLIVRDGEGKTVYENNFDDPENPGFAGRNLKIVDGMLRVGVDQVTVTSANTVDPSAILDLSDMVVLNDDGRTGTLDWTAPDGGDYTVIYYWQQGTANRADPATQPSYAINYFDARGLEALKEYWTNNVLNDPELNQKILASNGGVQLFMDSLEYSEGSGFTMWPENFDQEFEARKGYDIKPYLFLSIGLPSLWGWSSNSDIQGTYKLTDAGLQQKVLNDLYDVQTELYMEEFMEPFREWLHTYGITLRAQISYGKYLEISEPIQSVDFPETENRNQGNEPDMYRLWTGGSHLQNKVLSSETGGLDASAYAYDYQTHLQEAYMQYGVGVSRMIWHIWSAKYGPTQSWPGYEGGMSQFYKFGTREPSYTEYSEFNDHLGRIQQLLREGDGGVDVGMPYIQYGQRLSYGSSGHALSHKTMFFPSEELQDNGYSYDYFSPDFLTADDVSYNAETGTLELAGYKAIVLWQDQMTKDGAEALLNYAKQGLKVVVVDGAAVDTPYNDGSKEAMLSAIAELKTLANVKTVASADDVLEALQAMGVAPYAGYAEPNQQLLSQVRRDGDDRYLYLYNYCDGSFHDAGTAAHGDSITTEVEMDGTFIPYRIDAWTGEVTELANYRYEDGKTVFQVSLDYGDVALYAFEAADGTRLHVVDTALDAYVENGCLFVRATESGDYTVTLSNGDVKNLSLTVPQAYDITGWDVTVESWTPGKTVSRTEQLEGSSIVTTEYAVETDKTSIQTKLDTLKTWDQIYQVGKNVSGKGNYSAEFQWDGQADGAYLDFGQLTESMQVFINGQKTGDVNMNRPVVDISDLLIVGRNTIEIHYSSNLTNLQLSRGVIREGAVTGGFKGYGIAYKSYGPAQAVVVPYVERNAAVLEHNTVKLLVTGAAEATVDDETLTYALSVSGAERLATVLLTMQTENLADPVVEAAEGWQIIVQSYEDGVLRLAMFHQDGVDGDAALATVTAGTTGKTGQASLTVTGAELAAYLGDGETDVRAILDEASAVTTVKYSIYDVNEDGVVNLLDITRSQRCYGMNEGDQGWYARADVNGDGTVDVSDLILILNNFSK